MVVNDPVSILLNKEVIMIPSSPTITEDKQQIVIDVIRLFLESIKCHNPINLDNNTAHSLLNVLKNDCNYETIDLLNCNIFSHIDKSINFTQDNEYYSIIRNRVNAFAKTTLQNYNDKIILEIGPKRNDNERIISPNNKIETVDIVADNNTTYVADLTKENELPKSYFDSVYCLEVLEHTYEPWEIIKQINLLLKPGGHLHISMPFQFRIHGPLPDNYRISEFGLKYLLEKYNYEITHFDAIVDKDRPAFPIHYTVTCKKRA
jgi:SAM-dependent methyltransferase